MPIRPTALTEPGPLGATVTLENLETGGVVELRDSVFRFLGNPDVGSDGTFLHNYWTTERIEPGTTYRFSLKPDAGETAEADVAMPPEYQVEVWIAQSQTRANLLRLVGLRHVAFVETLAYLRDECGLGIKRFSAEITPTDSTVQRIPLPGTNARREGCGTPAVEKGEIFIVGSGAEWPRGRRYAPRSLSVSDSTSNVSNAVGFLGGVLTRLVPYERCQIINADPSEYCDLRYDDPTVATLRGTVTDPVCTGEGVAGATVALRQLDPVPPAKARLRFMDTNVSGAYEIGALEPGRYALGVSRYILYDPLDQYEEHVDTLTFAPGEQRTYDVGLRRYLCPTE
jgi:hypothetical protein